MTSFNDWNAKIIEEFRDNEGKVGGPFEGAPMILVHHIGAKSGTERVTPLACFPQPDDKILIVASKAGAPTNPDWYHNLKAHPRVEVEYGTQKFPVEVTEVEGATRDELFAKVAAINPGFGEYQEKTTRVIPLLMLSRV